ncbi:MAG: IclR family transcriptional regulator domain-containing protein [Actinopolymorphaceae bacterium]
MQSLERGLAVLAAFSPERPTLTLSDLARQAGLARSAARRFLLTLVDLGYVGVDGRNFYLKSRVLELGFTYLSSLLLPEVARPHLARLSAELGRSTSLGILEGDDVVYVGRVAAKRILAAGIGVGTRLPAYVSSHGRVLLAALPEAELDTYLDRVVLERRGPRTVSTPDALRREIDIARDQGWVLVDQELEEGVFSIAAPLRDASGDVVASINVAVVAGTGAGPALVKAALEPLLATVRTVEDQLRLAGTTIGPHR